MEESFKVGIKRSAYHYDLVRLRKEKNLTQFQLAEILDITNMVIRSD